MQKFAFTAVSLLALLALGCIDPRITNTGRSAVEQNLISHAVERTVDNMSFSAFAGKKAVLDCAKLATQCDKEYVLGVLETHLALSGVKIVEKPDDAQIRIRFYCGVLATDNTEFNIGTPAIPIPVPDTGISFGIPPLSIFKRVTRTGMCRMSAIISDVKTDEVLCAYRGVRSRTFFNHWVLFMFIPYVTRDVDVAETGTMHVDFMAE